MYQKRTLRRMSPWTRELAKRTNEAELHFRRMKKLTDESYASDRKLLDMNRRLEDLASERGVSADKLTNDDFWPEEQITREHDITKGELP